MPKQTYVRRFEQRKSESERQSQAARMADHVDYATSYRTYGTQAVTPAALSPQVKLSRFALPNAILSLKRYLKSCLPPRARHNLPCLALKIETLSS